jgi:hypothetical protein
MSSKSFLTTDYTDYTDKTGPLKEEIFEPRITRIYANERADRFSETQNPSLLLSVLVVKFVVKFFKEILTTDYTDIH